MPLPLFHPRHFVFSFVEDRIVPRFHVTGVQPGSRVSIYRLETRPEDWRELLTTATVGADGWVELAEPLIVGKDRGFVAVPE